MSQLRYEDHRRLILWHASRALRRSAAMRTHALSFDDLVAELNIVWCEARDSFNPDLGVPFSSYLSRGIQMRLHEIFRKEKCHAADVSMDQSFGEEDDGGFHDVLPSVDTRQDDLLTEKQARSRILAKLSPLTRKFVELLDSPPPELVRAVDDLQARAKYARSRGLAVTAPKYVTQTMVMDLMGLTALERRKVFQQLSTICQKVNQR